MKVGVLASGAGSNFRALLEDDLPVVALATNRPSSGAADLARARGIPLGLFPQREHPTGAGRDRAMLLWLRELGVELVVLAGYDRILSAEFVAAFPDRVLNVHPSLLPAFAGTMDAVARALEAGVRITGCTIHLCEPAADTGPILMQAAVAVVAGDTVESLHSRIKEQEHHLLPEAVRLVAAGRVRREGTRRLLIAEPVRPWVGGNPGRMSTPPSPPRALLSVFDKSGLIDLARGLTHLGWELYSTGGTERALAAAGLEVRPVSDLTGFPEILDGRVKTLHPGVHAGLLARREVAAHMAALEEHRLPPIDLLCVNLYPFVATASRDGATFEEILENIDVGGPAMLRAAAKNHRDVIVVARPERYRDVLEALRGGEAGPDLRRRLAAEAFAHTAAYDSFVAGWLRSVEGGESEMPAELSVPGFLVQPLRYGENPHQRAAFYKTAPDPGGLGGARQLQGKELSYNNIQDAASALALVLEFQEPAAAIIKHTNPCGLALGSSLEEAYVRAFECDQVSAYGGVVAINRCLDAATARRITSIFTEVVIAPAVSPEAVEIFAARKNLRLLEAQAPRPSLIPVEIRSVPGGLLVQTPDRTGFDRTRSRVATRREPTEAEWTDLAFAWRGVKHVKSNAILLARELAAVGVGAGQMSRVEAAQIAVRRAGERARGSVMASDALLPFPDTVEVGIAAGATAVIQPGGSIRDREVIAAADAAGIAMIFTGERHFRH